MSKVEQLSKRPLVFALVLGISAHLSWGSYPVIAKKLLLALPPFALVAVGYAGVLLLMLPVILKHSWKESLNNRTAWLLMLVGAIRMVTNILSIQSTRAAYVQLINLLTPFVVALLGRAFFREAIPPYTFSALAISSIGSVLVIIREPSFTIFQGEWQMKDTIGISLAMFSNVFLAFYVLLTRHEQSTRGINSIVLFSQQSVVLMLTGILASICLRENWGSWFMMSREMWMLFGCLILVNLIAGNLLQINSLASLGAALFTSLMGARLVAALVLSALLLNEPLKSWWQILGAVLVILSIMAYMLLQTRRKEVEKDNP
ncbi:MAG: DMT family transporter [Acidobacteria bacterium]|nr:DMT family transporter [Acidobacteriota bacterium]